MVTYAALYKSGDQASGVRDQLVEKGVPESQTLILSAGGVTVRDALKSRKWADDIRAMEQRLTKNQTEGGSTLLVRPTLGSGRDVRERLESSGASGVFTDYFRPPNFVSTLFDIPLLWRYRSYTGLWTENPHFFSGWFRMPVLLSSKTKETSFGLPVLSTGHPLSGLVSMPMTTKASTPLSSLFRMPMVIRTKARLKKR